MNENEKIYVITVSTADGSPTRGLVVRAYKTEADAAKYLESKKYKEHARMSQGLVYRLDEYHGTSYVTIVELPISNG